MTTTVTVNPNYFNYLKSRGKCSKNTVAVYTKNIVDFFDYIKKSESEIDSFDVMNWSNYLTENNYSTATIAQKISTLKSYFKFLSLFKIIPSNPTADLSTCTVRSKPKYYMNLDMVRDMVNTCTNTRDKAIIITFTFTGMRVSELTNLTLQEYKEMRESNSYQIIINGKGNKDRIITFNEETCKAIDIYLADRDEHGTGCNKLFLSFWGNEIARNNLNNTLKSIAKNAGIPFWKEMSNHQLRSACASIYSENGVPVVVIQQILGHSNIATTFRYTKTSSKKIGEAVMNMSL